MRPTSILGDVRGFARDFALDSLPGGFVWDLVDYIPRRRGARLDGRGPWSYFSPTPLNGQIWAGYHAPFRAGRNLIVAAGGYFYDVDITTGVATQFSTSHPSLKQNGIMLRDRVYFSDATAAQRAKYITRTGSTLAAAYLPNSAPVSTIQGVYKDRLMLAGDPAQPQRLSFSPLETTGGPPGTWDALSYIDTSLTIQAVYPMGAQILVFHDGSIEKIRGSIPPGTDIDTDMYLDPFTDQMGCADPPSVVGWQENVIWASPRGVYLSDGSTIRSLTEQGGIADLWRILYTKKRTGTWVTACVFRDLLFVSVLTNWDGSTPADLRPFTLVCDLTDRVWYRFANCGMTAAIPSLADVEEVWWGVDPYGQVAGNQYRLSTLSSMLFTERDLSDRNGSYRIPTQDDPKGVRSLPVVDAVDGNGVPVLPQVETGWLRLGQEGVKRLRHILVSHSTARATPSAENVMRVSYRLRPAPFQPYVTLGDVPGADDYDRFRLRLDKRGYGITVKIEQILPTYISRLHDIAVNEWEQDRGKL